MPYVLKTKTESPPILALSVLVTLIVVFLLFFIDEGYYDLRWMSSWGNWLVFTIYLLIIFPVQYGIHWAIDRLTNSKLGAIPMMSLTMLINVLLLVLLFVWI